MPIVIATPVVPVGVIVLSRILDKKRMESQVLELIASCACDAYTIALRRPLVRASQNSYPLKMVTV